jgi:hypothetical protein
MWRARVLTRYRKKLFEGGKIYEMTIIYMALQIMI